MTTPTIIYSANDHGVLQKVIQAIEHMDNLVFDVSREYLKEESALPSLTTRMLGILGGSTGRELHISENDLRALEAAREAYQRRDYDIESMLKYLARIPELAPMWDLATASMLRLKNAAQAVSSHSNSSWGLRYKRLWRAGTAVWESVVPCSNILSRDGVGATRINGIIDKLASLDDVLDVLHLEFGNGDRRERLSDELRDTILVLVQYFSTSGGAYAPLPSSQQIQVLKLEMRRHRNTWQASEEVGTVSSNPSPQTSATVAGPMQSSWRSWISAPGTITACVTILTSLSTIPGLKAWEYSTHEPGTARDADFWFLVQGSTMQLLGLLTIIIPLVESHRMLTRQWFWTWGFVGTSFACAVAAVPIYLHYSTGCSSTLAFIASAAQGFVVMQTVLIVNRSRLDVVKED